MDVVDLVDGSGNLILVVGQFKLGNVSVPHLLQQVRVVLVLQFVGQQHYVVLVSSLFASLRLIVVGILRLEGVLHLVEVYILSNQF